QLKNIDLAGQLSRYLNRSVCVQNDALCAAIGEQHYGAGQGITDLIHVTLGTGIGGGLIINDRPYFGRGGMAMEIGHLQIESGEPARRCGCGQSGCLEAHASATALSRQYQESTGKMLTGEELFQQAESGDHFARQLFEKAGNYLGMALSHCVKILDIHHITISGGPIGAWPLLYPHLIESLRSRVLAPQRRAIQVVPSSLDDQAGILGAAVLALTPSISHPG
ncbi:MAG: ROK family protein, partial [Gammaproteobacteria bacterium]